MAVVCPGVTLGIFANQSKTKGFRDKTCSSAPSVLENRGSVSYMNTAWLCSSVFRALLRRYSGELRLPGAQADGLHPRARGTGVASSKAR